MVFELLTAGAAAAPQNKFGIMEALMPGGHPNWISISTVAILGIMSFGTFFILITKWMEQKKIMGPARSRLTGTVGSPEELTVVT